ncbi:MAG: transporter substrate-binding domain-containing protein [Chloroflexi bacterium]|nr:transporter substrate-binding domain-containing protein [Chloroflexota bacterium]
MPHPRPASTFRRAALGALLLNIALAACGSSDKAATTASTPAAAASPAAAVTTAATTQASGMLAQVKSRGVLRVANTQANPPWNFRDDKNDVAGYDIEVAQEIAKRMGIAKVEFVQGTFQTFIPGVQTDKWDIVVAGQTITEERKGQVDFSNPYEVNGVSIFVAQSNTAIKVVEDLKGKRIAVTAGGTQEKFAREQIPNADVKSYENATLALTDVGLGRADAYLGSRFVGAYLAEKTGLKVKPTPGFIEREINAMSFKKGEAAFKAEVDRALAAMIADGTLSRISQKWLGGLDMVEELKTVKN